MQSIAVPWSAIRRQHADRTQSSGSRKPGLMKNTGSGAWGRAREIIALAGGCSAMGNGSARDRRERSRRPAHRRPIRRLSGTCRPGGLSVAGIRGLVAGGCSGCRPGGRFRNGQPVHVSCGETILTSGPSSGTRRGRTRALSTGPVSSQAASTRPQQPLAHRICRSTSPTVRRSAIGPVRPARRLEWPLQIPIGFGISRSGSNLSLRGETRWFRHPQRTLQKVKGRPKEGPSAGMIVPP
jgi:hypothetical protein